MLYPQQPRRIDLIQLLVGLSCGNCDKFTADLFVILVPVLFIFVLCQAHVLLRDHFKKTTVESDDSHYRDDLSLPCFAENGVYS